MAFCRHNNSDRDSRYRPDTCHHISASTQLCSKDLAMDYTLLCESERKREKNHFDEITY